MESCFFSYWYCACESFFNEKAEDDIRNRASMFVLDYLIEEKPYVNLLRDDEQRICGNLFQSLQCSIFNIMPLLLMIACYTWLYT